MSGKALLVGVVAIVFASGTFSLLTDLTHFVATGQVGAKVIIGLMYVGLAIWLYRGSNAARLILAVLYGLGTVLSVGYLVTVLPRLGSEDMIIWTVFAVVGAAVLWALLLSKPFRAALAGNAARFGRNAA